VVGFESGLSSRLAHELLELRFSGHAIEDAAGTYEKICNREGLSGLNATRLLYSREFEPGTRTLFFQAIVNRLIAAAVLTLLSPLLVLIAALVRLSSREGVLDRQLREGCNGPFTLYASGLPPEGLASAGFSPAPACMLCRSLSMCCAGRCRSWDHDRSGRSSGASYRATSRSIHTGST